MTEDFKLRERDESTPPLADFSIIINDKAMEPLIRRGQMVYVSCRAELAERDTGLFFYDGQVYCRRWCEDYTGALLLMSGDGSQCIYLDKTRRKSCLCLGKVIL